MRAEPLERRIRGPRRQRDAAPGDLVELLGEREADVFLHHVDLAHPTPLPLRASTVSLTSISGVDAPAVTPTRATSRALGTDVAHVR